MSAQGNEENKERYEQSGAAAGTWLVVGIIVAAIALGFLAHYNLKGSADVVSKAQASFATMGKKLGITACVKKTLRWNKRGCSGLKILCQASIPRVVGACLEAQKRVQRCRAMDMGKSSSHFAYKRCKPFGFKKRADQKACVLAFNTVYSYCFHLRGNTTKRIVGPSSVRGVPSPRKELTPPARPTARPTPRRKP